MKILVPEVHPDGWQLFRLGQLFRERREKVSDKDFLPLSVTKKGIVPQLENAAKSDDGDNRKLVRVGDFVINSRSDRKGSSGLSSLDGSVSLINIVLEPKRIVPGFSHHLLRSYAFQEEFYRWGHGIVADLWTTRYSEMKDIRVLLPDRDQQQAIADFLDRETARIDQLIEKKQRLVELLDEKRKAEISIAVKGKGEQSSMRLRSLIRINPSKTEVNLEDTAEVTFAPMEALMNGVGGMDTSRTKPLGEVINSSYNYFREDDLLLSKVTPCFENGKKALAKDLINGIGFATSEVFVIRANEHKLLNNYLLFLFSSQEFQSAGVASMTGAGGLQRISEKAIRDFILPVTSIQEQAIIANKLVKKMAKLDAIIDKTNQSIDRLREFRSALINAAVTGQIDVNEWSRRGHADAKLDAIANEMEA